MTVIVEAVIGAGLLYAYHRYRSSRSTVSASTVRVFVLETSLWKLSAGFGLSF